jgi:hypothetical protein
MDEEIPQRRVALIWPRTGIEPLARENNRLDRLAWAGGHGSKSQEGLRPHGTQAFMGEP